MFKVKNRELADVFLDSGVKDIDVLISYITSRIPVCEEDYESLVRKLTTTFLRKFKEKWQQSSRTASRFLSQNEFWLDCFFEWSPSSASNPPSTSRVGGRPLKDFQNLSERSKRRRTKLVNDKYTIAELHFALVAALRSAGKIRVADSIDRLFEDEAGSDEDRNSTQRVLTKEEALALYYDVGLTKRQYGKIRSALIVKQCSVLPAYYQLLEAKQQCYPQVLISEGEVRIPLQSLLDLTTSRLVSSIVSDLQPSCTDLRLSWKWGCDGSSNQSTYKQNFEDPELNDESVFMISCVPLQLTMSTDRTIDYWTNPRPSSTRLCRPIYFVFAKETASRITDEVNRIKDEIDALQPTSVKINDTTTYCVHHELFFTMIDGKVRQFITNTTSSANCCVCGARPSEMNNLLLVKEKEIKVGSTEYGLSSLHAWIRFMECILHIAYRLPFEKWSARSEEDKKEMIAKKQLVQKILKEKIGIVVDTPKQGAGSSNDGNTARRFFRNWQVASEATGVNVDLIRCFYILLQVLACGQKIDAAKFNTYCMETYELYVRCYSWYYMPSSVHMILLHGQLLVESILMPIGWMSEEAQEARNKDFRKFRQNNARKCSRKSSNEDIIHNLLVSSDPLISSFRPQWQAPSFLELDDEAKLLLAEDTSSEVGEDAVQLDAMDID